MTDFGSGIYLNPSTNISPGEFVWDIELDGSGDIRTEMGVDELQKDIAFNSAIALNEYLGSVIRPVTRNRIKGTVKDVFDEEDRIASVRRVTVLEADTDKIRVKVDAITEDGPFDFVVGVSS